MATIPRFGLDFVGDTPWGTHLCVFYETKDDLRDILVPYFAEGLRSNEACVWVTSEPFLLDSAREALAEVVGNLDPFIKSGQLLMLPFTDWHMKEGTFDADRVLQGWIDKEVEALEHGFEGLRLAGNTFWIERRLWNAFTGYEEAVNRAFVERRIIALCPYSLQKCTGSDVADVMRNHVGTIMKKEGGWSIVEDVLRRKAIEKNLGLEAKRAETFRHIIITGNRAESLQQAAAAMVDTTMDMLDFDSGGIFLRESNAVVALYVSGYTPDQRTWAQRLPITQRRVAHVMAGSPWISEDYQADVSPEAKWMNKKVVSMATIPLVSGHEVIGFYQLADSRKAHHFSKSDVELLVSVGQEAGTVIGRLVVKEALKESETRSRKLIERNFDGVIIHSNGIIRFANEAAARITKASSPDELIGMSAIEISTPEYRELMEQRVQEIYRTGESLDLIEIQMTARDGTTVDIELSGAPITYEGKPAIYVVARDISERKQMETQLKHYADHLEDLVEERTAKLTQSEEEFRTLFDKSSIAQIRYDAEGLPIRMNNAAATLLGVHDVGDISHRSLFSDRQVPQEDLDRLREGYALHVEQVCDFPAIREGGLYPTTRYDIRQIDCYVLPLVNLARTVVEGYLLQFVDITERKRAEEALEASEKQYRTLVETANSSIFTLDNEGTITFVNDYGARALGYTPDELIGKNVMLIVPETESSGREMAPYIGDIVAHPDEHSVSINENITKDGRRLWFNWVNKTLTDGDGHHIGHLTMGYDITELKRVQDSLVESKEQLQRSMAMVDLANEAIIIRDPEDRITYWNHGAERLYGWNADEARGEIVYSLLHTTHPVPLEERSDSLRTNGGWVGELEHSTKDGRRITVESHQTLQLDAEGALAAVFEINADITAKKAVEDALGDAQRLASVGETAAMIGHDLRNPLQALQYLIDLQKMRFDRTPPEERDAKDWEKAAESFDRIGQQIFYMDKIVGDLQDYARPLQPQHERISLSNLVEDVLAQVPHDTSVWVTTSVDGVHLEADRHLMHRAFANLILNAVQAMPEGGTLTIAGSVYDHAIVIKVKDTGVGIPAEIEEKLFTPLVTGKAKGTGLGLAVAKRIIDAHGGTITFESERGKGTTFTVTLPASAAR